MSDRERLAEADGAGVNELVDALRGLWGPSCGVAASSWSPS